MGASGWSYFVNYKRDPNEALQELRWKEFKNKRYYVYDDVSGNSPDELLRNSEENGTHSIIDITGISETDDLYQNGTIKREDLINIFGTDKPTREMIVAKEFVLQTYRGRWACTYVVCYKDENPTEIYFTGYSGD
jgi:hypothetical protein